MRNQCNVKNCKNKLLDKDNMCHNFKSPNAIHSIKPNGEPYFACLNYELDKVNSFINDCGALVIEKDIRYAFNQIYSSPFIIRPETIEKIKKLLYDDLMATCEEDNNGVLHQEIQYNNLNSFIEIDKIWKKKQGFLR